MDNRAVMKTVEQYAKEVTNAFSPSAILLYGSYSNGTPREESDIDVAVVFDGFTGDWLETSAKLWKLRREISDDIEPILLDSSKDPSGFVADILKTGTVIYRA